MKIVEVIKSDNIKQDGDRYFEIFENDEYLFIEAVYWDGKLQGFGVMVNTSKGRLNLSEKEEYLEQRAISFLNEYLKN